MTSAIATNTERAPQRVDARTQKFLSLKDFLTRKNDQVAAIAGKALDPERVLKIVLDAAASNEKLLACSPESLLRAMLYCAKIRLEPVGAWGVWLVPYGTAVTPIIDYRALISLVKRAGDVRTVSAHVVYEHDVFDVQFGDDESIRHVPELDSEKRGKLKAVYAIATLKDGMRQRVVLAKADVDRYRAKSKASGSGPWVTDYEAMAMKTAIKRLCNLLPIPHDMGSVLDEEERAQGIDPATIDPTTGEVLDEEPAPAQVAAGSSKADALKAQLRAAAAGPVVDTTATPIDAAGASEPSRPPEDAPASPAAAEDAPPFTEADMADFRAKLTALEAELVDLAGPTKAKAAWNGASGPGSLRGVRSHAAAEKRLTAARALVDQAKRGDQD